MIQVLVTYYGIGPTGAAKYRIYRRHELFGLVRIWYGTVPTGSASSEFIECISYPVYCEFCGMANDRV